ncbi:MAG: GFA family protein [Burkholderiales bacterium]
MYTGGCLCGAVKYEVRGDLGPAFYCHCSRCRKASGSAFASNVIVATKDFFLVQGKDALKSFDTTGGVRREFCSQCGSPIASRRDSAPEIVRLRMGTIDTPITQGPGAHIFVASKAKWFPIFDELPQHPERP